MKIVVCPDSFKGTLSASEAALAMREGIREVMPEAEVIMLPLGDGGEGTANVLTINEKNAERVECATVDALHRPIKASYFIKGNMAVIESAAASGLTLIRETDRDIMRSDTYGTGLLIRDALEKGIREFILCMGGTATCDGGRGAFSALHDQEDIFKIAMESKFTLLCDVANPLCGPCGAAPVFGPQKGAVPSMLPMLEEKLKMAAKFYLGYRGRDVSDEKYAGAAGGLAGMFMSVFDAVPVSGAVYIMNYLSLSSYLKDADLVMTGEGRADATTLSGKVAKGVLDFAKKEGVPVALVAGKVEDKGLLLQEGFNFVEQATPDGADPSDTPGLYVLRGARRVVRKAFPTIFGEGQCGPDSV